ncbi:MAG: dienelactone hydrolase family protein [Clostridia bacterium]|nr:dienelactone hydrolase family protein [Clostridia bacterium]
MTAKSKEMKDRIIVSAISLWKKYDLKTPLGASEWGIEEKDGEYRSHVSYSGHTVSDGSVRIYARFCKPLHTSKGNDKYPTILLLPDAGKATDEELMEYFVEKGYAVLMPDYSGKCESDGENVLRTIYPQSLDYGNYERAQGLYGLHEVDVDGSSWFEWTYVALYSIEYLKSRVDVGDIGVVGIRKGGEIAWQTMLSPDVKCGVPINAAGWRSFLHLAKFGDDIAHNLSDDRRRYIAAAEAQSYAPYVKCPVLMLCALRDWEFDCDRAYDTYSRIGNSDGNALVYSADSGACIGATAIADMELFLEKNLKGREIYIPDTLNLTLKEVSDGLEVEVEFDKEGILEEAGVFYAEADARTKSTYRDWHRIYKVEGRAVKNGKTNFKIVPFAGATAVFAYAYAKYINGFCVMSKITCKRRSKPNPSAVKSRMLFTGKEMDTFGIAQHEAYSVGGILMERETLPKITYGYGDIQGAYSVSGIKTYKISSPKYVPEENALLEFDAYSKETQELIVSVEVSDLKAGDEKYTCVVEINGGGKWKRTILRAVDFKSMTNGKPLENFRKGSALSFESMEQEKEFSITNILWL